MANAILAIHQRTKDRATYLGTIDHPGRRVREAVRVFIAWTTITHPPIEILANLQPTKDRATYLGTMDHPDNATVRSAVGFVGDACWLIEGG